MPERTATPLDPEQLRALRDGLATDEARAIIDALPEPWRALLARLAAGPPGDADEDAIQVQAAAQELAAAMPRAPGQPPALPHLGALTHQLAALLTALDDSSARLDDALRARPELTHDVRAASSTLQDALPEQAAAAIQATFDALIAVAADQDDLATLLREARAGSDAIQTLLRELPRVTRDPDALIRASDALGRKIEHTRAALDAHKPQRALGALLPALDQLAALARDEQHPELPRVLLTRAAFIEAATLFGRPARPGAVDAAWAEVIDAAERAGDLDALQYAARRQQAAAFDRGDLATLAALARRVATLADAAADPRAATLARIDEALAAVQLGDADNALALAHAALRVAADRPLLQARALTALGQLHDHLDHLQDARDAYAQAADLARHAQGDERDAVLGAALQGIAGIAAQQERYADAADLYAQARALALDARDWPLYARAALALTFTLDRLDLRPDAIEALVAGRAALDAALGQGAIASFEEAAALLAERWGEEAFNVELQALRRRLRGGDA